MFTSLKFLNHTANLTIKEAKIALFMTCFLFGSVISQAQTVTNGSMTGVTGNSVTPPGWTNVNGLNPGSGIGAPPSVDLLDINFTAYMNNSAVPVSPSPDGGTWTGLSSLPPNIENEAIEQVVSGFTVGATYELSFYAANFGGTPFIDPGVVTGYVNGTAVAVSPTLNLVPNVWTYVSGTFIASANSMTVQLDAIHNTGDAGTGGYYSVDGLEITPLGPCLAGNNAPVLGQTSVCLTTPTFDLTGIPAGNTPDSTGLTWHSDTPATNANTLAGSNAVTDGTYYAAFYDTVNDCYGPTTAFNVYPAPAVPTITASGATTFCAGGSVTLTSSNGSDYLWSNGETTASIDVIADGSYTVIITDANGCTSPASTATTVVVDQLPDLTVTEVNNTITATQTGAAYQWIDCGNGNQEIAGATGIAFTPTVNGSYAVIITSGACSDTSACTVISTIGLNEQELVQIGVHPNPGFDVVEVTSTGEIQYIEMYAVTGEFIRLVQEATFHIDNMACGIYLLKVTTNQGTGMIRLVKE